MSLIRSEAVSARLAGARVLDRVDFAVQPGELVGLIGPNGAGKTTLLRVLAGLLAPAAGRVVFDGRPLAAIDRRALARRLAYLPQAGASAWPVAVEAFVMLGRQPHIGPWRGPSAADRAAAARAMAACDVGPLAGRAVTALSGGERARVLLARALAGEPALLLADEPVAGLDPAHQLAVMGTLADRVAAGAAAVVVMHDLTLAARFCGRLALLDGGRMAADSAPMEVLSADNLARTFGIDVHRGSAEGVDYVIPLRRATGDPGHAPG